MCAYSKVRERERERGGGGQGERERERESQQATETSYGRHGWLFFIDVACILSECMQHL